jgi:hypothetical protein
LKEKEYALITVLNKVWIFYLLWSNACQINYLHGETVRKQQIMINAIDNYLVEACKQPCLLGNM